MADVWDEIWVGAEKTYSDRPVTQNQVFEHVKINSLKKLFPKNNFKMLEVGCGTAFVSLYFAKHGALVTCLDTNKKVLSISEHNFKSENARGTFVLGDAEKLPFKDNTFDVVSSFGLMEHFPDPTKVFNEMVRVTKKDGLFFADIVPNRFSIQSLGNLFNLFASFLYGIVRGRPLDGWNRGMRNLRPLYYESSIGWREYKNYIERAGIRKVTIVGNRPFPRLTLPRSLDKLYASIIKLTMPYWRWFDTKSGSFGLFWGAGWWFWGTK